MSIACGGGEQPPPAAQAPAPQTAEPPAADPHAAHAKTENAAELPALPALPADAKVGWGMPVDGATSVGPLENGKVMVKVAMTASGVAIKPAGAVEAGSGHHHILIDVPSVPAGTVVPKDEQHLHFGQAQTEASIPLGTGPHTLTLQLADGLHRSYGEALSASIKVTVAAEGSVAATPP
jgi:hypothetical protein